jgi:hypothetical protein
MAGVSPYTTALKLGRPKPDYVLNEQDANRVTAYWTYWDIFRNVEDAFLTVLRNDDGDELSRRCIPAARTIIEATNRYLAKDPTITPNPIVINPDGTELQADIATLAQIMKLWSDLASREEFWTKFMSMKRWMLIRGDAILHLTADDTKPEGTRLSINEVDPSGYFTIPDAIDPTRVNGVYLVSIVDDDEGEPVAQRQRYIRLDNGAIWTQLEFFAIDKWDDRAPFTEVDLEVTDVPERFADSPLITGFQLDPRITQIPVYHYRNNREGGMPFGISELQGIETLLAGITQTATDEDQTVVLTGVGIYVTTSGKPRDSDGNEQDWVIAPASVMELESTEDRFDRVPGVTSVQPLLDHMGMLEGQAQKTTGTPDIAVGRVEVTVAESGVALAIEMAPILAKNAEKEQEIKSKTEQMLFDLVNMWLVVYEGLDPKGVTLRLTFGDPLPPDRKAILAEITEMISNKLISTAFAQTLLRERLGYDIPKDDQAAMLEEQTQILDATGARLDEAAAGGAVV